MLDPGQMMLTKLWQMGVYFGGGDNWECSELWKTEKPTPLGGMILSVAS